MRQRSWLILAILISFSMLAQAQFITTIASGSITSTGATITWTTCAASNSIVNYGSTNAYGLTASSATSVTSHSIVLSGLTSGIAYHYQVVSVDINGIQVSSADNTFTTTGTGPSVTVQPQSATACVGGKPTFTSTATGTPSPTVQWQRSTDSGVSYVDVGGCCTVVTTPGVNTTTSTMTIVDAIAAENANLFNVIFTNGTGSATSSAATLTVNGAPAVTTQPMNVSVVVGATATFSVVATYSPTYQWQYSSDGGTTWNNVTSGTGQTAASYTTPATVIGWNGFLYRAAVTNSCATATVYSNSATLTVTASILYGLTVADNTNLTTNARTLQGATLTGNEWIFTSPAGSTSSSPTGITSVKFWLDETGTKCVTGTPNTTITTTPYRYANPWNTDSGTVANGTHTINQLVTKSAGGTECDSATFTVSNTAHYVTLGWTAGSAVNNPITFNVYRGTTSCSARIAASLPATQLTYTDNSVTAGTTYYYCVSETDSKGNESAKSSQVSQLIP